MNTCTQTPRRYLSRLAAVAHGFVTVWLLSVTVAAQSTETSRSRAIGMVRDAQGKKVAGAEILLWSWPLPGRIDIGKPDLVTVNSRSDGRFSAEIFDGRTYSAFARWQDARGWHASQVESQIVPGSPRILQEAAAGTDATVVVRGTTAWRAVGPLQVTLVVGTHNPLLVPLQLDASDEVLLPAHVPPGPASIDVRTSTGRLLQTSVLPARPLPAVHTIELADVHRCTVIVEDAAGTPLPFAEVHVLHDFGYRGVSTESRMFAPDAAGRTAPDGRLTIALPARHPVLGERHPRTSLLVSARDHQRQVVDVMLVPSENGGRVRARLSAGTNVSGRLIDRDARPVTAGVVPLFEAHAQLGLGQPAGAFVPLPPMAMSVAADGTFLGPGLHDSSGAQVFAVVEPTMVRELGMPLRPGEAVPPMFALALQPGPPGPQGLELGDVRIDRLQVVRVVVVDHHGAPAAGARVRMVSSREFSTPMDFLTDRVGRLQLPIPDGDLRIGAYVPGGGVASTSLQVPHDVATDRALTLQLTEPRLVRGELHAAPELAAADVSIRVIDIEHRDPNLVALACSAVAVVGPTAGVGAFEIRVPFGAARYSLRARSGGAAATATEGPGVSVVIDDEDVDGVRLEAPPAR